MTSDPEYMEHILAVKAKGLGSNKRSLRSAPLRAIVDKDVWVDLGLDDEGAMVKGQRWKLECGHTVRPPVDMYAERFPKRMRCGECRDAAEVG